MSAGARIAADATAQAAELFDLALTPAQTAALAALVDALLDWNTRLNLTAITDEDAVRVRHLLDSLSVAPLLLAFLPGDGPGGRVLDLGTGAGFPGLPLAIALPHLRFTLLDSTAKKLKFIDHVAGEIGLGNVTTLHQRAEEAGHDRAHRQAYDFVLARAVARLPALLEYALPLVKLGGRFVAMKGSTVYEEVDDSGPALRALGGMLDDVYPVHLPGMDYPHHLAVVEKRKPTPKAYPRQPGIPSREPIE